MHKQSGFSLLELMTVLTVAGVLLGIGVPSLVTVAQNNRILATSNEFISSIHAARMEAIKRRTTIVVCASANPAANVPNCSDDFSTGWIVFVDRNRNGVVNPNADPAANDAVLVAQSLDAGRLSVSGVGGNYLAFAPSGFVRALPGLGPRATSLKLCDERGNVETTPNQSAARVVVLAGTGRPELRKDLASVTAYGGC